MILQAEVAIPLRLSLRAGSHCPCCIQHLERPFISIRPPVRSLIHFFVCRPHSRMALRATSPLQPLLVLARACQSTVIHNDWQCFPLQFINSLQPRAHGSSRLRQRPIFLMFADSCLEAISFFFFCTARIPSHSLIVNRSNYTSGRQTTFCYGK